MFSKIFVFALCGLALVSANTNTQEAAKKSAVKVTLGLLSGSPVVCIVPKTVAKDSLVDVNANVLGIDVQATVGQLLGGSYQQTNQGNLANVKADIAGLDVTAVIGQLLGKPLLGGLLDLNVNLLSGLRVLQAKRAGKPILCLSPKQADPSQKNALVDVDLDVLGGIEVQAIVGQLLGDSPLGKLLGLTANVNSEIELTTGKLSGKPAVCMTPKQVNPRRRNSVIDVNLNVLGIQVQALVGQLVGKNSLLGNLLGLNSNEPAVKVTVGQLSGKPILCLCSTQESTPTTSGGISGGSSGGKPLVDVNANVLGLLDVQATVG